MTRHRTWALVADAVHARILRNLEDGAAAPPQEILRKAEAPHLRRLLTDKSGRSLIAQLSRRGSTLEQAADPVARDMQEFARDTLGLLGDHLHRGHLSRLAIFAAPRMLGALRRDMPAPLKTVVVLERNLNLIHLSEAELRRLVIETLKEEGVS